ncbi:MAG: hypothetical protein AABZ08_03935 [Planctomycetota bacterium]
MKRVVVIRRDLICTQIGLIARCLALGFLAVALDGVVFGIAGGISGLRVSRLVGQLAFVLAIPSAIAIPIALPINIWLQFPEQMADRSRAGLAGFAYGVGLALMPAVAQFLAIVFSHSSGSIKFNVLDCIFPLITFAAIVAGSGGASVLVSRYLNARIEYVERGANHLCPGCSYDLIGNESMTCPECGRVFTYEELGMTDQEFRERQATSKAMVRERLASGEQGSK